MNWDRFQKSVGIRVQVEPPECCLDESSHVLPDRHYDWLIEEFLGKDVVVLRNINTEHLIKLGKDHIYDFRSNPSRSRDGIHYGFLVLKVQVFLQGAAAWVRPNGYPGERVAPSNAAHHQVQWTPYFPFDTVSYAPPTAESIKIQYRLWSDVSGIPLQLRVASNVDGSGISQEFSGPSGVFDQMLDSPILYFSLSHPEVKYEIRGLGWKDRR